MVKIGRKTVGKLGGIGLAVAVVIAAGYIAKRYDLGGQVVSAVRGAGLTGGQALISPIAGLVEGITKGASDLGEQSRLASEGFQKSVSSVLGGGFNVFSEFGKGQDAVPLGIPGVQTAAGDTGAKASVISIPQQIKNPSVITVPIQNIRPEQRRDSKIPTSASNLIKEITAKLNVESGKVQSVSRTISRATPTKNTATLTTSAGGTREIKNISDALRKRLEMNLSKPTGNSGINTTRPSFTVR